MKVELRTGPFDPWREVADYEARHMRSARGKFGAASVFVGTMRGGEGGGDAQKMFLEHYPGMTEKRMAETAQRALDEHDVVDALVVHRVGEILPGEPIVLVAIWSAHRGQAYRASRQILEELKSTVPFWKKEHIKDRTEWVKENTPA